MVKDIERVIIEVNATMEMENMPLTDTDKSRIRLYAGNRRKVDEEVGRLIRKHTVKKG